MIDPQRRSHASGKHDGQNRKKKEERSLFEKKKETVLSKSIVIAHSIDAVFEESVRFAKCLKNGSLQTSLPLSSVQP